MSRHDAQARLACSRKFALDQLRRLREDIENLQDYLDVLAARVRNEGKPTYTAEQVRVRLNLKP